MRSTGAQALRCLRRCIVATRELAAAVARLVQAAVELGGAVVQVGQCGVQRFQVALRAGRAAEHQFPTRLAEHDVDTLRHFGGKAACEACTAVVVALAGVDRQLGRAGAFTRHGLTG